MTMITISTTDLTISSLLGSRAMSNRDVGVRRIGPLAKSVNELIFCYWINKAGGWTAEGKPKRRKRRQRRYVET